MTKEIRCFQCQTIIATLPDDDPHTFPQPVLCADCTRKKAQSIQSNIRPTGNDQTASKVSRARTFLRLTLSQPNQEITAILASKHRDQNGNTIREYYLMIINGDRVELLNPSMHALGFGFNRQRGTIRINGALRDLIDQLGQRLRDDPAAFHYAEIDPTA